MTNSFTVYRLLIRLFEIEFLVKLNMSDVKMFGFELIKLFASKQCLLNLENTSMASSANFFLN